MPRGRKAKSRVSSRSVPYARGYKPPTDRQSLEAISPMSSRPLPRHLEPTGRHFAAIPRPSSVDDWLAQYNEDGQTYDQFTRECPWLSARKWKQLQQPFHSKGATITEKYPRGCIYLLALGSMEDGAGGPCFSTLVEYVEIFYGLPVKILDTLQLVCEDGQVYLTEVPPKVEGSPSSENPAPSVTKRKRRTCTLRHSLESRHSKKSGHRQLRVHSILSTLVQKSYVPSDAFFLMALTMYDLYEDPSDLFVAGMASGNHRVGVFSFSRYVPNITFSTEFWYDITTKKSTLSQKERAVLLGRSCKLLVHEIAHLLGMDHCIWYDCCMNGSGHLQEDFRQSMFLCPVDLHKLETLCGFDVVSRYASLRDFFGRHDMAEEKKWIEERLKWIKPT